MRVEEEARSGDEFPPWLYPDKDALVALDKTPTLTECLRTRYPQRTFTTAFPGSPPEVTRR
jgi:hypothetical protein